MEESPVSEEMNDAKRDGLNWRGLTSLTVTLAFLVLAATGVVLYVSPQGRVANWTGWNILGLGKEQWAAAHTTASLLFLIASGFHVYFNWRVLVCYIVLRRRIHLNREMMGAAAVVAAVFAGTILGIQPFSSIVALNTGIKAYWEKESVQAPYPHAEASTLTEFSERTGIPLTVLQDRLSEAGIAAGDPSRQTLDELARAHHLSPKDLFAMVSGRNTPIGQGSGVGRQTVQGLCESSDIPLDKALSILRERGYEAEAESTLKALAQQKGLTPVEVRDLLVEQEKQ